MDDCDFGSQLHHKMEKMKPDWGYFLNIKQVRKLTIYSQRNHVVDLMQGRVEIVWT
jgi:hypothetical protein